MRTPVPNAERVAIARRTRNSPDTKISLRATHGFDDNRLWKYRPHAFGDDASDDISRPASRVGHNHCDGPRRIALSPRDARYGYQCSGARGQMQKLSAGNAHGWPP